MGCVATLIENEVQMCQSLHICAIVTLVFDFRFQVYVIMHPPINI